MTRMSVALLVCMWVSGANAAERWVVAPIHSIGVSPELVDTFSQLLVGDLSAAGKVASLAAGPTCRDAVCARELGRKEEADVAIFGSMTALGVKKLISISAVDVKSGELRGSGRMSTERTEELDTISSRIATALTQRQSIEQGAELGNLTAAESQPDKRREGTRGVSLRLGGQRTLRGYSDALNGVNVNLSYWFETRDFAIEPRVGIAFDVTRCRCGYFAVPVDVSAHYLFSRGDVAPFVGIGAGIQYTTVTREELQSIGTVLVSEYVGPRTEDGIGLGLTSRAGVMLLRTYALRVALSIDYSVNFIQLFDIKNPQMLGASVALVF